ncbi:hypothetical protein [Chryseobacterium sp. KCF3-3]|uniref:hypothetical protein n=1 Tax=Chryseobacterium sp. KCF3-3 TaxID=3231511 RepID=UPI0038B22F6D
MRKIIYIFIISIGLGIKAQTNGFFTPTKGEIIFREITKITSPKLFDESLKVSKQKFKESLRKSFLNNPENKDREQQIDEMITAKVDIMEFIYVEDSTQIYQYEFGQINQQPFSENIILKIDEDRNNRKTINGYDCFKVTYQYQENKESSDEDYLAFAGDIIYQREMWVTEKIRSLYHPVVFDKSILEKYYPLSILETQNSIKGFERRFKLDTITAN